MSDEQQAEPAEEIQVVVEGDSCPWCRQDCGYAIREAENIAAFYHTLVLRKMPKQLANELTVKRFDSSYIQSCGCEIEIFDEED
jgi:hypothetical protein